MSFVNLATLARQNLFVGNRELEELFGRPIETAPYDRFRYAERFFDALGTTSLTVIDNSRVEAPDAFVHDLNLPIPETLHGRFDAVLDVGTLEHVFNYPVALANAMRMVHPGGHLILATVANNYTGHGLYQFSPELFFRVLGPDHGFVLEEMIGCVLSPTRPWYDIPDPASYQDRGCLVNAWPVLLFVRARRTTADPIPELRAQQSDYAAQWAGTANQAQTGEVDALASRSLDGFKRWMLENAPWLSRAMESLRFSGLNTRFSIRNRQAFRPIPKETGPIQPPGKTS